MEGKGGEGKGRGGEGENKQASQENCSDWQIHAVPIVWCQYMPDLSPETIPSQELQHL